MNSENIKLSEAERFDWLRLIRSENVGPRTFFQLIEHLGTASAALEAAPELSRRGGRKRAIRIATAIGLMPSWRHWIRPVRE